jgi:hypothetical protein
LNFTIHFRANFQHELKKGYGMSLLGRLTTVLFVLAATLPAQLRVDPRYSLHRAIAVVPLVGSGTPADPKRGKYVPTAQAEGASGTGIIAFAVELTDDGTRAIVELVAVERATLAPILADHSIQVFEKGVATNAAIESAIRPSRKDFSLQNFGVVLQ